MVEVRTPLYQAIVHPRHLLVYKAKYFLNLVISKSSEHEEGSSAKSSREVLLVHQQVVEQAPTATNLEQATTTLTSQGKIKASLIRNLCTKQGSLLPITGSPAQLSSRPEASRAGLVHSNKVICHKSSNGEGLQSNPDTAKGNYKSTTNKQYRLQQANLYLYGDLQQAYLLSTGSSTTHSRHCGLEADSESRTEKERQQIRSAVSSIEPVAETDCLIELKRFIAELESTAEPLEGSNLQSSTAQATRQDNRGTLASTRGVSTFTLAESSQSSSSSCSTSSSSDTSSEDSEDEMSRHGSGSSMEHSPSKQAKTDFPDQDPNATLLETDDSTLEESMHDAQGSSPSPTQNMQTRQASAPRATPGSSQAATPGTSKPAGLDAGTDDDTDDDACVVDINKVNEALYIHGGAQSTKAPDLGSIKPRIGQDLNVIDDNLDLENANYDTLPVRPEESTLSRLCLLYTSPSPRDS